MRLGGISFGDRAVEVRADIDLIYGPILSIQSLSNYILSTL